TFATLDRVQPMETSGRPGDPADTPIDYTAFASTVHELSFDIPAPALSDPSSAPVIRPFDETFISVDLFAQIAAMQPGALPVAPVPSGELVEEKETGEVVAAVSVPPAAEGEDRHEEADVDPAAYFAPFLKPADAPAHLPRSAPPYAHLRQELAAQRMEITAAMDELLPLVYDNHREENQTLFASILANRPPLDDEAWGHAAFVLGAYGNYMYRHPLSFTKKLEIWRAQLWAVYYERSYRRKYLAQRCQQLIHFFQGCAENPTFLAIALHDLETLYLYLEPGSLRKLQQMLQGLPVPPQDLLQRVEAQMVVA